MVLIIEDEHQLRTLLALILEQAGYKVLEAAHSNEAASVWRKHQEMIDLIVADVWLPGISGPELVAFLRKEKPSVKTVFITGLSAELRTDFGKLVRGAEVVSKPFTPQEIVNAVQRAFSP